MPKYILLLSPARRHRQIKIAADSKRAALAIISSLPIHFFAMSLYLPSGQIVPVLYPHHTTLPSLPQGALPKPASGFPALLIDFSRPLGYTLKKRYDTAEFPPKGVFSIMAEYETYRPSWVPEDAGKEFACKVMTGIDEEKLAAQREAAAAANFVRRRDLTVDEYVDGILKGDRMILSRAITLIESNAPRHFATGQEIIQRILPYTGKAVRLGITGVPGAGKSTFIECLGNQLCDAGKKVAVLAVDPSSSVSRGSVLGDKTRMETLAKRPEAFIRPSPSGGTLGGVTRKSRETMLACEAAGYDTILVETVGVGQSEIAVRAMVDFFLVVVLTGAGDDLQGIKKGVIETADAILVNKADGDNKRRALVARAEYDQVLHYLRPATEGWNTKAYTCSAYTGEGVNEIWNVVLDYMEMMQSSGRLTTRRQEQTLSWVRQMTDEYLHNLIYSNPNVIASLDSVKAGIMHGDMSATRAAQQLIDSIETELRKC